MVSTVPVWLSRLPSNETEVRFDYFFVFYFIRCPSNTRQRERKKQGDRRALYVY